ncbi:MAG TPA: PDDEXK nuclease domain-containing protein [Crocinitomicaceae bacterium]|nr:PDDEXK nuclease domain-containing protein [Crocinitomicaceae bacterium]
MSTLKNTENKLLNDIRTLIDESRNFVAITANTTLVLLYWKIGNRLNSEVLNSKRAEYGKQVVATLAQNLTQQYGKGWGENTLRHSLRSAETFTEEQILSAVRRHLGWTHLKTIMYLKDSTQREFYIEMCIAERWTTRTLRNKIDGMLYERTAISKKPKKLIQKEIAQLREQDKLSPDLVFKDPYFLNFLGLKDTYSEKDLENAILHELELFILELGMGFTFVERQKRMVIDNEDFKLDLLFFHRKLKRLIAVELKLGKFKPAYKAQMELYLRWLEKNEMQQGEKKPIGLILCAEGSSQQIELLQLDKAGIKVAQYLTELPDKKLLQQKIQQAITISKQQLENND